MSQTFQDQVAIISGGGSGMGREAALRFAERGMTGVVVVDIDEEMGKQVAAEIEERGAQGIFARCDVTQEDQVVSMVRQAHRDFGRIDVLYNAAGSPIKLCNTLETSLELWEANMALNLRGSFLCAREALRYMVEQRRGAIVNMASDAAFQGNPGSSVPYAAAKAGVITLTVGLAREFADRGIRVNAVSPGHIDTPLWRRFAAVGGEDFLERISEVIPMGRLGTPQEVAELVCFLCSDACPFVTGVTVRADGGMVA